MANSRTKIAVAAIVFSAAGLVALLSLETEPRPPGQTKTHLKTPNPKSHQSDTVTGATDRAVSPATNTSRAVNSHPLRSWKLTLTIMSGGDVADLKYLSVWERQIKIKGAKLAQDLVLKPVKMNEFELEAGEYSISGNVIKDQVVNLTTDKSITLDLFAKRHDHRLAFALISPSKILRDRYRRNKPQLLVYRVNCPHSNIPFTIENEKHFRLMTGCRKLVRREPLLCDDAVWVGQKGERYLFILNYNYLFRIERLLEFEDKNHIVEFDSDLVWHKIEFERKGFRLSVMLPSEHPMKVDTENGLVLNPVTQKKMKWLIASSDSELRRLIYGKLVWEGDKYILRSLTSAKTVEGSVTKNGLPLANYDVLVRSKTSSLYQTIKTDSQGRFKFQLYCCEPGSIYVKEELRGLPVRHFRVRFDNDVSFIKADFELENAANNITPTTLSTRSFLKTTATARSLTL